MNKYYLYLLYKRYKEITCKKTIHIDDSTMQKKNLSQNLKKFILKLGISSRKMYEHVIKSALSNSGLINFEEFVESFQQILTGTKKSDIKLKFNFLLMLFPHMSNNDFLTEKQINKFFDLIECEYIYQSELCDELAGRLILRYSALYANDEKDNIQNGNYRYRKMQVALESFFEGFNE